MAAIHVHHFQHPHRHRSIILFTVLVRLMVLPLNFRQIKSSTSTAALQPKLKEIKEKFPDNKDLQNQLSAMVFQVSGGHCHTSPPT